MFKLKFAKMYDNSIFEKNNLKPVSEDYFCVKENIFCVADGVTRDSIYGEAVPYPKNKQECENWIKVYPNPSGAYDAAKVCADSFVKYVVEYNGNIDENVIDTIIKKVNKDIGKLNEGREIDYLANDLFCSVAVGGIILQDYLYCFSIGDSHITGFDSNFNICFTTINNHKQFENFLNLYCKDHEYDWNNPKDRVMVRRDFRNKPQKKYNGKEVSFGVLSGEKEAEHYIDVYKVDLSNIKYICAYSDGCEEFFRDKEHTKMIIQNPEKLQNEGKERTLIIYEKEK